MNDFINFLINKILNSEKNLEVAIARKDELYLPLLQELQQVKSDLESKKYRYIKCDFIKDRVEHNYIYLIDKQLLKGLEFLLDNLEKYNKINEVEIAKKIINESFENGFSDLYGSIIEGYRYVYHELYDVEEEVEVLVEEVEWFNINHELVIELLNDRKTLSSYHHRNSDKQTEEFGLNRQLVDIYEQALNSNRKVILEEWEDAKGVYIASSYDFNKQYDNHIQIKEKEKYRDRMLKQLDKDILRAQDIIKKIVKNYEKKGLKY